GRRSRRWPRAGAACRSCCGAPPVGTLSKPETKAERASATVISGGFGLPQPELGDPAAHPVHRHLLRDGATARIVQHHLAPARRAQRGQELIEPLATEAESLRIGTVTEGDDTVFHAAEVGPRPLQRPEEITSIV